ncbi:hypothetical protein [Candidatus Burkholderia verschuerenii]|uniref:hypothetical protein n=1 Tax=Candidatus Burkholderia verschuerenii TaxID=242163 RepID=UPI001E2AA101|nr:hypothetical protein [Candidatus Burkholderia verschuerenii]
MNAFVIQYIATGLALRSRPIADVANAPPENASGSASAAMQTAASMTNRLVVSGYIVESIAVPYEIPAHCDARSRAMNDNSDSIEEKPRANPQIAELNSAIKREGKASMDNLNGIVAFVRTAETLGPVYI